MRIFQRIVLLIKVMVMLAIGTTAAWANSAPVQDPGFWGAKHVQGSGVMVAMSQSDDQSGDQEGDQGSDPKAPGTDKGDDDEEGDSDT